MTKNKEINVFSVSFLDLLSGALAAVIILFIIIPKATPEAQDALDTLQQIEVSVEELEDLIELARNSIPTEIYDQIMAEVNRLNQLLEELRYQLNELQEELARCRNELARCIEEQNQLQQSIDRLTREIHQANERISELELELHQTQVMDGISDIFFGVNAKLGVVCSWDEDTDVDLWMRNNATNEWINYRNQTTSFGVLMEDITSRGSREDFYELIFQSDIVSGSYEIFVHLFSTLSSANVTGAILMFPGHRNEIRIDYGPIMLRSGLLRESDPPEGGVRVGTLTITENNISLQR